MNKSALIGYSGFVGSNLVEQYDFTDLYNSKNIKEIKGKQYDLLICAGIPSAMWLANSDPKKDLKNIVDLMNLLRAVKAKKFILISTIAVYKQPVEGFNEDSIMFETELAYGKNRHWAEEEAIRIFEDVTILRLPALFGKSLKKNFIYDLLNLEPTFLKENKYNELIEKSKERNTNLIVSCYQFDKSKNMYRYDKNYAVKRNIRAEVQNLFKSLDFTSLVFTNSQSKYQFYFLDNLMHDIQNCIDNGIPLLNICSEPIKAYDIAKDFFGFEMNNDSSAFQYDYDLRSKYSRIWNNDVNYLYSKKDVYDHLRNHFEREQ